jgi:hypothetical protein
LGTLQILRDKYVQIHTEGERERERKFWKSANSGFPGVVRYSAFPHCFIKLLLYILPARNTYHFCYWEKLSLGHGSAWVCYVTQSTLKPKGSAMRVMVLKIQAWSIAHHHPWAELLVRTCGVSTSSASKSACASWTLRTHVYNESWLKHPPNFPSPVNPEAKIYKAVTSYHVRVEGWSQPLVV